jgi:hypothetical protein
VCSHLLTAADITPMLLLLLQGSQEPSGHQHGRGSAHHRAGHTPHAFSGSPGGHIWQLVGLQPWSVCGIYPRPQKSRMACQPQARLVTVLQYGMAHTAYTVCLCHCRSRPVLWFLLIVLHPQVPGHSTQSRNGPLKCGATQVHNLCTCVHCGLKARLPGWWWAAAQMRHILQQVNTVGSMCTSQSHAGCVSWFSRSSSPEESGAVAHCWVMWPLSSGGVMRRGGAACTAGRGEGVTAHTGLQKMLPASEAHPTCGGDVAYCPYSYRHSRQRLVRPAKVTVRRQ